MNEHPLPWVVRQAPRGGNFFIYDAAGERVPGEGTTSVLQRICDAINAVVPRSGELDLAPIRERCKAATDGPWEAVEHETPDHEGSGSFVPALVAIEDGDPLLYSEDGYVPAPQVMGNMTFIAAARLDVPALCDEVERLRRVVRHVQFGETSKGTCYASGKHVGDCWDAKRLSPGELCNACALSFATFSLSEMEAENMRLKDRLAGGV